MSRFDLRIGDYFTFKEVAANTTQANQSTAIKIIEKLTEDESLRSAFECSKSDRFLGSEEISLQRSAETAMAWIFLGYEVDLGFAMTFHKCQGKRSMQL